MRYSEAVDHIEAHGFTRGTEADNEYDDELGEVNVWVKGTERIYMSKSATNWAHTNGIQNTTEGEGFDSLLEVVK